MAIGADEGGVGPRLLHTWQPAPGTGETCGEDRREDTSMIQKGKVPPALPEEVFSSGDVNSLALSFPCFQTAKCLQYE